MSPKANKKTVNRFFKTVCNGKKTDIIQDIFAEEVNFNGVPGSYDDVKKYLNEIWSSFDEVTVTVDYETQIAEGEMVSTERTWTGTLKQEFRDKAPGKREVQWSEISIVKFKDGKIVDDWLIAGPVTELPEQFKTTGPKKLKSIFLIIAIILIAGILIYFFFPITPEDQNNLRIEFVKQLIELILIGFIGAILIREFNEGHERIKNRNEFKKKLFSRMSRAYVKAKKVRRILEARINERDAKKYIPYPVFEKQMEELIDAQLEFEFILNQMKIFSYSFEKGMGKYLKREIKVIEEYLNHIIDEYQKFPAPDIGVNISELTELNEFVYETDVFKGNFSKHFNRGVAILQKEILDL